jgi:hypothetical protein
MPRWPDPYKKIYLVEVAEMIKHNYLLVSEARTVYSRSQANNNWLKLTRRALFEI